ncbi:hypothetical protein [Caballeronia sp. AZ7_KS35]|uniref:hypothetical protein n=1 Tax=Caballeronia sp. AZ7_KS35 TaxID=2921762 RepID=UPI0020295BDA|nr:hypothetical protein [Caballeronia sp. AZ7_KS35]
MLDTYRKPNTTDWMEIGREVLDRKEAVLACLSDDSNARKKAAATRFFYSFVQSTYGIKQGTARQLIRNYQRFGGSNMRADLERAFTTSELTILAARTDDEVASRLRH